MSNPLAPYFNRTPTPDELATVPVDELTRIADAAREVESLNTEDLASTREWARNVRAAVEQELEQRQ